jgi:hypothetical protein
MSNFTLISNLPGDNSVQQPFDNAMIPPQQPNDIKMINTIMTELQQVSLTGCTLLKPAQPQMIPQQQPQMIPQQTMDKPSLYDNLHVPVLIGTLYFLFSLPYYKKILFRYIKFLFKSDGNYNINGYLFTSITFGTIYYMINTILLTY